MIQIHRLEGFYWVAESGGFARAARAFPYPITQPAVHQQVRKLERELGVALFERVGKDRMQVTPAGRKLLEFCAPFFRELPAVVRAVRSGEQAGELSIHAEPMMLRHLLPQWLRRLQGREPGIQIDLRELAVADYRPLREGHADLLVGSLPEPPADVATLTVAKLLPFFVLPAEHRVARRRLGIRELGDETFVGYHRELREHALQMRALELYGVTPRRMMLAGAADTIVGFVASGLGYSLVPSLDPNGPSAPGVIARPLRRPKVAFDVIAAWRRDAPDNRLLDLALETAPRPGQGATRSAQRR